MISYVDFEEANKKDVCSSGMLWLNVYKIKLNPADKVYLKACQPHQIIRTSDNSKLCKCTMMR